MKENEKLQFGRFVNNQFIIFILVTASILVYSQHGLYGRLVRDDAIYFYSAQQFVKGVAPYTSIFDPKGPVTMMLPGVGIFISNILGTDDLLTTRVFYLLICALTVLGIYLIGTSFFKSRVIGVFSAFTFIAFWGFGKNGLGGPRAKLPMVIFEILTLYFTSMRKWMWAGFFGALCVLTWQPMAIFPIVTLALSIIQSEKKDRLKNAGLVIGGGAIPYFIISLYFIMKGSFLDFLEAYVAFPLKYIYREPQSLGHHLLQPVKMIFEGYTLMAFPIIIGFILIFVLFFRRLKLHGNLTTLLKKDEYAVLYLTFIPFIIWSIVDFQSYPDFYVFLPYCAITFGWFLSLGVEYLGKSGSMNVKYRSIAVWTICAVITLMAFLDYSKRSENGLISQREIAGKINREFGENGKIVSIGVPQLMVLMHRTNPNRYLYVSGGIDNKINAETTGGFKGWLNEMKNYNPDIILYNRHDGHFSKLLINWLNTNYRSVIAGKWILFLKYPLPGNQ